MQRLIISVMVVVLMVAIGLRSSPSDFTAVWKRPLPLLLSLIVNLVIVPLIAAWVVGLVHLPHAVAVGLLICSASPAGPAGPLFALRARGHVATAVTGMVILSLISVVSAPITISWVVGRSLAVDLGHLIVPMIGTLFVIQLLPLVVGMLIRLVNQDMAERWSRPATKIANGLLLLVVTGLLITKGRVVLQIGSTGVLLFVVLVLVSLGIGALVSTRSAERRAYFAVTGVRNISLALLVSATYFLDPATDAAVLTFGLVTTIVPLIVTSIVGAIGTKTDDAQTIHS